jgi:hypothetical protein
MLREKGANPQNIFDSRLNQKPGHRGKNWGKLKKGLDVSMRITAEE